MYQGKGKSLGQEGRTNKYTARTSKRKPCMLRHNHQRFNLPIRSFFFFCFHPDPRVDHVRAIRIEHIKMYMSIERSFPRITACDR